MNEDKYKTRIINLLNKYKKRQKETNNETVYQMCSYYIQVLEELLNE